MDFGRIQSRLDQSTLDLLVDAFDHAWTELQASNGAGIADEVAVHDELGRQIISAAITLGAHDPEKVKRMALDRMTH